MTIYDMCRYSIRDFEFGMDDLLEGFLLCVQGNSQPVAIFASPQQAVRVYEAVPDVKEFRRLFGALFAEEATLAENELFFYNPTGQSLVARIK